MGRNDAMKGKLELLPNLLRTHNYDRKKDVWDMAIWNLFSICKCPMKDGNILEAISQENAKVAKMIESAQAQAMDEGTPMNEALMSLMWQFSVTMRHSNRWTYLLAVLSKGQPGNYKYLPTMPHDDLVEVTASLSGRLGQATKWFMCREGHPYAIGDCGQPNQLGKCPCG